MRQLTAGFLSLTAFLGLTAPLQAQAMAAPTVTPSCSAALTNAQKRLESEGESEVVVSRSDISTSYVNYSLNRPFKYTFAFRETARGAVMTSPKFMLSLATEVIHACDTVSLVTIGVAQSSNLVTLGLMPGGQVKAFDRLEPTRNSNVRPTWRQPFRP